MKKAQDAFSILGVILSVFVICGFYNYNKQKQRFDSQKLGVTLEQFKADWGEPKEEFLYKEGGNEIVLVYDSDDFLRHNYVFKFSPKSRNLTFKYYDD